MSEEPTSVLRWYVTCSLSMHNHPDYARVKLEIGKILQYICPDNKNELVEARGMYQSAQDWKERWPKVRDNTINGGLFFLLDSEGFIGKGVYTEVWDIIKKDLPVYLVTPSGSFYPITALNGPAFVDGPDWKTYLFIDARLLDEGTDPSNFEKSDFGDFKEQTKPGHWKQVHTRLITSTMEATLKNGQLILKFTGGVVKTLERMDVEALTHFLYEHAGVDLSLPDLDEGLPDLDEEYPPDDTPVPNNYLPGNPYR